MHHMKVIKLKFIDAIRTIFFDVAMDKMPFFDCLDFYIDSEYDLEKHLGDLLVSLRGMVRTLELAVANENADAILVTLLEIRRFSMGLSSYFDNIHVDMKRLFAEGQWSEIPDGYSLPDIYVDKYLDVTGMGGREFIQGQFGKK